MKTLLQLLIAAIVINASVRGGLAAMRYYQFKDTAQQAVLFGAGTSTAKIRQRILDRAEELNLPVDPEKVSVDREGTRTWANASYRQSIELFPNQPYTIDFDVSVEGYSMMLGK